MAPPQESFINPVSSAVQIRFSPKLSRSPWFAFSSEIFVLLFIKTYPLRPYFVPHYPLVVPKAGSALVHDPLLF